MATGDLREPLPGETLQVVQGHGIGSAWFSNAAPTIAWPGSWGVWEVAQSLCPLPVKEAEPGS